MPVNSTTFTQEIANRVRTHTLGVNAEAYKATIVDTHAKTVMQVIQEDPEGGVDVIRFADDSWAVAYTMRFDIGTPIGVVVDAIHGSLARHT